MSRHEISSQSTALISSLRQPTANKKPAGAVAWPAGFDWEDGGFVGYG
jgi:hypothetical protein